MDAAWFEAEQPVVGIVERTRTDDSDDAGTRPIRVDALEATLNDADGDAVRGDPEDLLAAAPSLLVAAGEQALSAIARADPNVPVLPVGDVPGIDAVDHDVLPTALEAALAGEATIRQRSVLGLTVEPAGSKVLDDEVRERALFDVALVTEEPAQISEYGVSSRGESVATVRADGVVVATSAGSHGYASAVDAPHLSASVDAVAVTPIAPFVVQTRQWVLPEDSLALTVERNETVVTLVADDRPVCTVDVDSRVEIAVDGSLSVLSVPDASLEGE